MSWELYRWVWELRSPVFVGTAPAGALNRCRLYVPARALWGAITAELAQGSSRAFREEGQLLLERARFSYLFPAKHDGQSWRAWLPRFETGRGLTWTQEDDRDRKRSMPDREFRLGLLEARAGTAIAPATDTAEDGSLRETECIAARWRSDSGDDDGPVALVGYLFIKNGTPVALEPITTLFLGGDTRYGLGRVKRLSCDKADKVFGAEVELNGDAPCLVTDRVLAHVAADGAMSGGLERLVGWDRARGDLHPVGEGPLWVPGSSTPDGTVRRWEITAEGIWRAARVSEAAGA